ncbi:MAG: phosphatidate cytidylyltransferase [Cyanobacteria bacterium J06621_11]
MIHSIFGYTSAFLLLGGGGMHFANRFVDAETRRQRWVKFATYIVIVGVAIATILLNQFYLLALLISAIGLWEIMSHIAKLPSYTGRGTMVSVYMAIAATFITFAAAFNQTFFLFIYFQIFIFDGFSQVVGQLFGKRKILPTISPGKTLEGLIGGTLFCCIAAISAKSWIAFSIPGALTIGLLTAALSFTGDALASYFKRKTNIKDYSHLLPEHGGILDRFDSLMMAGAGYATLSAFQLSLFQSLQ